MNGGEYPDFGNESFAVRGSIAIKRVEAALEIIDAYEEPGGMETALNVVRAVEKVLR